jgi:hypothetical protein
MKNILTKGEEDEALLLLNWFIQKTQILEESIRMGIPIDSDKEMRIKHAKLVMEQLEDSLAKYPSLYGKMKERVTVLIATERSLDAAFD